MFERKSNAFTLIELIATLVIMAIIALIVTPLVMNIIRKARISADKRSVDAYGRSIELAIAGYLLDTGKFPTEVSQLTIEYSGNKVECETTQINTDSSVYLAGCTVNGRSVEGYTYGKEEVIIYDAYSVGDEVTYNKINYYVIKDSSASEDSVTLLKSEPLTYEEITTYSAGTGAQTNDRNGYGGMSYHESSSDYSTSYVKHAVDAWKIAKAPSATETRLITKDELVNNLGYELTEECVTGNCYQRWKKTEITPSWVDNSNYSYWTMSSYDDCRNCVWNVTFYSIDEYRGQSYTIRPVIVLPKSAL